MKRKTERLLIDQKALRQGLTGKVEREDRPAWHVGGTQQLTGRRLSLLRCRKSDSRGMIDHDVFRTWNRHRSANDHLHVSLSLSSQYCLLHVKKAPQRGVGAARPAWVQWTYPPFSVTRRGLNPGVPPRSCG